MLRFAHPIYLYALLLVPFFTALFYIALRQRKKALALFGTQRLTDYLTTDYSSLKTKLKFVILMIGFAFLIIAIADPQVGSRLEKGKRKGADIMIALDVSNSMLAEDIKPSRLERAKQAISKLIDRLDNDRIGIVVFAGKSYTQLPITTDYAAAKLFLSTITPDIIPTQGTAIGNAIETCATAFNNKTKKNKAIIIISDGENHEDDAIDAASNAREQGIIIHTIGMGLPEGAPIPIFIKGIRIGYKKDETNNTIISKLNEEMLEKIAGSGQGIYVRANNAQVGLDKIFENIDKLEKTEFESRVFSAYEDRFQYFIALALIFLIIEIFIPERKGKLAQRLNIFGNINKK